MSLWGRKVPRPRNVCVYMWDKLRQVSLSPSPGPEASTARCNLMLTYNMRGVLKGQRHLIPSISGSEQFSKRLCIPWVKSSFFFFCLKKHVYFSRNLIPGVPTPSHLHQLKWHFWRDMRSCRSLWRLSSAWSPFSLLDLKQKQNRKKKKRKSRFLTKSFLQIGLDWIFFSHGFFGHIVLLPCMMETAVRPQAVACGPRPWVQTAGLLHRADRREAGPLHENQTSFCSGRTLEVMFQFLAPPSQDEETDVQGGNAFLGSHGN